MSTQCKVGNRGPGHASLRHRSLVVLAALLSLAMVAAAVAQQPRKPAQRKARAAAPAQARQGPAQARQGGQTTPQELHGPLTGSILVPPVRKSPPTLTHPLPRPEQYDAAVTLKKSRLDTQMEALKLAIDDLIATFGPRYPRGPEFREHWHALLPDVQAGKGGAAERFAALRDEALLANPLLDFERLLVLKRKPGQLGLPTNHQTPTSLPREGYDNELAVLSSVRPGGRLETLYRPASGSFVGEMDLNHDGKRLLFTMSHPDGWEIHEIGTDGTSLRQITRPKPDVENFDACYLPDGRIVFASTASMTGVPCWHGKEKACCLYSMNADGGDVRQLCYDQDLDLHPAVLANGQVIYSRWDYTGLLHAYVRPLMVMNPDGTAQRAVYGSNCYYPNCLFYPRAVPGKPNLIAAVISGYHGKNRQGEVAILDLSKGWTSLDGIVTRITHRDEPIVPLAIDTLTAKAWPQFLHPYPLSDTYLLVSMQASQKDRYGIYLVDVFDNITPVLVDPGHDFYEPIPLRPTERPVIIPDRVDLARDDARVILQDVYRGPGLAGVPRGTIKSLRIAAYNYGLPGMAGPDKIGRAGPWEAIRILGTVPVHPDGSAQFRVPANTPITIQALDEEGKAVQLMRSWYTAMPGETATCVGCHETPRDVPDPKDLLAIKAGVAEIEPWYGPARGFDFAREVQPVLDRHCVACHQGGAATAETSTLDLRDESLRPDYRGLPLTNLGATRLDPYLLQNAAAIFQPIQGMPLPYGNRMTRYTPAYEALIPYIRRVNVEDGVELLNPGEYHADTSELVQLLKKGHHGVALDRESWDRLVTWIDLNGPCHGTWNDVAEVPHGADQRRRELARQHGGPDTNPELIPALYRHVTGASAAIPTHDSGDSQARTEQLGTLRAQLESGAASPAPTNPATRSLDIGQGQSIRLVRIPAGRFLMGDESGDGLSDEWPPAILAIDRDFWIGTTEVTNAQFRAVFGAHTSGYFTKRQIDYDGPGIQLNEDAQPAVRVSWLDAMRFCRMVSERTGAKVTLPTEAQWEYAARAGTSAPFWFGDGASLFTSAANLADRSLACIYEGTAGVAVLQPFPAAMDQDDRALATAPVGSYQPNAWGLFDIHGNAAEWTRSQYRPYPSAEDGRDDLGAEPAVSRRVVRGGSFLDRPAMARAAVREDYPAWQAVHDAGFRVIIEEP